VRRVSEARISVRAFLFSGAQRVDVGIVRVYEFGCLAI